MTRTVALGEPTDEMKKVYNTVLLAQKEAFKRIKSGVKTSEVDFAARDFISYAPISSNCVCKLAIKTPSFFSSAIFSFFANMGKQLQSRNKWLGTIF